MYDFTNNQALSGVLPGHSTYEVVTYRGYVLPPPIESFHVDRHRLRRVRRCGLRERHCRLRYLRGEHIQSVGFLKACKSRYVSDTPNPSSRSKKE